MYVHVYEFFSLGFVLCALVKIICYMLYLLSSPLVPCTRYLYKFSICTCTVDDKKNIFVTTVRFKDKDRYVCIAIDALDSVTGQWVFGLTVDTSRSR